MALDGARDLSRRDGELIPLGREGGFFDHVGDLFDDPLEDWVLGRKRDIALDLHLQRRGRAILQTTMHDDVVKRIAVGRALQGDAFDLCVGQA